MGGKDKDIWIEKERRRWAERFNIAFADGLPEGFPNRTVEVWMLSSTSAEALEMRGCLMFSCV